MIDRILEFSLRQRASVLLPAVALLAAGFWSAWHLPIDAVPGIAEVNESGGDRKQFVIQPKPDALAAAGLTFSEISERVAQNVENAGGGIISRGGEQLTGLTLPLASAKEEKP